MNKVKIGLIAASATIVGGFSSAVLWNGIAHGEWDFPGLQQQVQHVTEVTNNHEGRITNLEGKVNTPSDQPTPTPVVVTKVVTQEAPQTSPAPAAKETPQPIPTPAPSPTISWYRTDTTITCDGQTTYMYTVHWSDSSVTNQSTRPESGREEVGDTSVCRNKGL